MAKKKHPAAPKAQPSEVELQHELRLGREFMQQYGKTFKALAKS